MWTFTSASEHLTYRKTEGFISALKHIAFSAMQANELQIHNKSEGFFFFFYLISKYNGPIPAGALQTVKINKMLLRLNFSAPKQHSFKKKKKRRFGCVVGVGGVGRGGRDKKERLDASH